jgi:DNA-directed RNA polymerase subunit RPC12/RpoP
MADVFDHPILCKKCNRQMDKEDFSKDGFKIRSMRCGKCGFKVLHPLDEAEYNKFINLKNREFKVKMRLVGNSYAVSIPREIVNFMHEQEKMMNDMVKLCFDEANRLSLHFDKFVRRRKNG